MDGGAEALTGHQPPMRVYREPNPAVRVEGMNQAPADSVAEDRLGRNLHQGQQMEDRSARKCSKSIKRIPKCQKMYPDTKNLCSKA